VARRLLADDMSSGWGLRTLSSTSPNFNPMSYHNGSVWPHDNSLVAAGLRRYGYDEMANRVMEGVFLAGLHFRYFRLPELYCGFTRDSRYRATPAEYPVSCSPQSWAAGSAILFLKTMLGIRAEAWANRLVVRPRLPDWLAEVTLRDLHIGGSRVDFTANRDGVEVLKTEGDIQVVVE
jgi:glycogen debranching enzyme